MEDAFRTWGSVILATVATVPLGVLVVIAFARRRVRAGAPPSNAWRTSVAEVVMGLGTVPWIWMILTPRSGTGGLELMPGQGLATILAGKPAEAIVQVGGNLLVFSAFGFFAPVRWPIGIVAVAASAVAGSALVETLQYALRLGRISSIDDIALNTFGAAIAALCSHRWWILSRRHSGRSKASAEGPGTGDIACPQCGGLGQEFAFIPVKAEIRDARRCHVCRSVAALRTSTASHPADALLGDVQSGLRDFTH